MSGTPNPLSEIANLDSVVVSKDERVLSTLGKLGRNYFGQLGAAQSGVGPFLSYCEA